MFRKGFEKFWKAVEIDYAIFQDPGGFGKGGFFKLVIGKFLDFCLGTSEIS